MNTLDVPRAQAWSNAGFSLIEVMIAMVVLAFAILGVMASFRWSDHAVRFGTDGTRALALAEARLEAKRSLPWPALLLDDLNHDGRTETVMRDDGAGDDETAGDGVYTAADEQDGIRLVWTVQPDRSPFQQAGLAVIRAKAGYSLGNGRWRHITVGTIRSNPAYVGSR